jgi:hypothetical protein
LDVYFPKNRCVKVAIKLISINSPTTASSAANTVEPHQDIVGELPEAKQQGLAEHKQPTSQSERKEQVHVFLLLPNDKHEGRS